MARQRKAKDTVHPLKVSLEDLYNGATRSLRLTKNILCKGCSGKGLCYRGMCICEPGHFGDDCTLQIPCPNHCSNKGDCFNGKCTCFPGYEGYACNRMVCPNDCSGKGTCQSTSYLSANPSDVLTDWYDTVATANSAYAMWDGTMAMSCKCDPGYSGPDCSVRMCPVGDDPVTITNQVYETQFVDIFTTCEGTGSGLTTDCPTASATTTIGGSVTLTFTDHFGEAHTTAPIAGLAAYEGSNTAFALAAQAALRALPNNVVSDSITVHSMFCEYLEPSETAVSAGVATVGGTVTSHAIRALAGTGCVAAMGNSVYGVDGKVKVVGSDTGTAAVATKDDDGTAADCTAGDVSMLETPLCHRLVVNFDGMAGNFANLKVDVSEATHNGKTNAQDAGSRMSSTVTSRLKIAGATTELGYTAPGSITVTNSDSFLDVTTTPTQTDIKLDITATGNIINQAVTNTFPTSSRVKVECGGTAGTTYRNLGVYTVLSATANILSIEEVIPVSTIHDDCGSSALGHYIKLTMVSHIVTTGVDAGTDDAAAADTSVNAGLILPSIQGTSSVKVGIGFTITSGGASYVVNSHYSSSDHSATLSTALTAQAGSIIMYSEATVSNGKNAHHTGGNAHGAGTILGSHTA